MLERHPKVGTWYMDPKGNSFEVIGFGTNGVVVEYPDGKTELIDKETWGDMECDAQQIWRH